MTARATVAANEFFETIMLVLEKTYLRPGLAAEMRENEGDVMRIAITERLVELFGMSACKADESEPIFTLRAQDKSAPAAVRMWTSIAQRECAKPEKVLGARAIEEAMIEWQGKHRTKAAD